MTPGDGDETMPATFPRTFDSHLDDSTMKTPVRWSNRSQRLYADASDLGFPAGTVPNGIRVRSHRTGAIAVFENPRPDLSPTCPDGCCGGDLRGWTLTAATTSAVLYVFND